MRKNLYIDLSEGITDERLEKIGDFLLDGGSLEYGIRGFTLKFWLWHYGVKPEELIEEAKKRRQP